MKDIGITYRGVVHQWHCDHMGHMNVMWYVGKFDEATWNFGAEMGLTSQYLKETRRGMAAVEQRICYRREALVGDVIAVRTALLEVRPKSVRFVHEMFRGELVPCFEVPDRADFVLQALRARGLGSIESAPEVGTDALARVHAPRYLQFLSTAWAEWIALDPDNAQRDALPSYWPIRTFRTDVLPASFPARMGLFSFDAGSPITAGTWTAARQGGACAVAGAAPPTVTAPAIAAAKSPPVAGSVVGHLVIALLLSHVLS